MWVIERGHGPEWVLGLDFLSFCRLADSCIRLDAVSKIEQMTVIAYATNGVTKTNRSKYDEWCELADTSDDGLTDDEKFKKDIGEGF